LRNEANAKSNKKNEALPQLKIIPVKPAVQVLSITAGLVPIA